MQFFPVVVVHAFQSCNSSNSDEEEGQDALETKERVPAKEGSPVVKKTVRKVDLGAAATYAQVQRDNSKTDETTLQEHVQTTQSSANELVDLFSSSESRPVASIPPFQSDSNNDGGVFGSFESAKQQQNGNDFADFSAFSEAKPASPKDDFADFQSSGKTQQSSQNGDADLFQDFASASSSNQDLLSKPTMASNVSMSFQAQPGVNMQPMVSRIFPATVQGSAHSGTTTVATAQYSHHCEPFRG